MQQASWFFMSTNVTPQKRDWRYLCIVVSSHELKELHQETFKNGEKHKLGDIKTPLDYTLSACTRLLFVFLSTQFYRINLERLL
jgi:hypothetical protein